MRVDVFEHARVWMCVVTRTHDIGSCRLAMDYLGGDEVTVLDRTMQGGGAIQGLRVDVCAIVQQQLHALGAVRRSRYMQHRDVVACDGHVRAALQ